MKNVICLIFVLALTGCLTTPTAPNDNLRNRLIGSWKTHGTVLTPNGYLDYLKYTFSSDSVQWYYSGYTINMCSQDTSPDGTPICIGTIAFAESLSGTWQVHNDSLYILLPADTTFIFTLSHTAFIKRNYSFRISTNNDSLFLRDSVGEVTYIAVH